MRKIKLTKEEFQILTISIAPEWRFMDINVKESHILIVEPDYKPIIMFILEKGDYATQTN